MCHAMATIEAFSLSLSPSHVSLSLFHVSLLSHVPLSLSLSVSRVCVWQLFVSEVCYLYRGLASSRGSIIQQCKKAVIDGFKKNT